MSLISDPGRLYLFVNRCFPLHFLFVISDRRKLIKNPKLSGLLGGFETVTLGDEQAKEEAKKKNQIMSKLKRQRAGEPIFDIIVELSREQRDEWTVVLDSANAVDAIIENGHYEAQIRRRDADTGYFEIVTIVK